jgi:hypothetical protein
MKNKQKKKEILQCCFDCGIKYGTKKPTWAIGVWDGVCDICGKRGGCASAPHDWGIYSSNQQKDFDKFQDLI